MLTEEQNRYVSDQVYLLDSSRADKDKRLIENKILSFEDKKPYLGSFQVLKVEDNQENGMQAMAVAPIGADGQPDYSQIIITYAGLIFQIQMIRGQIYRCLVMGIRKS